MQIAPATLLPRVTGSKLPNRNCLMVTSAPKAIPKGIKNIFAILCSPPKAQNERIGGQMAISLPGMLLADVAHQTAKQTNQLASRARQKACR